MKKRLFAFISISMLLVLASGLAGCTDKHASAKLEGGADKVLALVGDDMEITNADIQERFSSMWKDRYEQLSSYNPDMTDEDVQAEKDQVVDQILQRVVFQKKVEMWLEAEAFSFDESLIQGEIERMLFFQGFETEEEMFKTFEEEYDYTREAYLEQVTFDLSLSRYVLEKLEQNPEVVLANEEEIEEVYNQYKDRDFKKEQAVDLSVIMIDYALEGDLDSDKPSVDKAWAIADDILAVLADGKDFDKLAKKHSDNWTEEQGSLFRERFSLSNSTPMTREQAEELLMLADGEVSEIIDNQRNGFLAIYKVTKSYDEKQLTLDDMRADIYQRLTFSKNNGIISAIIKEIEDEYPVDFLNQEAMPEPIFEEPATDSSMFEETPAE